MTRGSGDADDLIPGSEELLATLEMACGCIRERIFPKTGLAHLMADGVVSCPEHGWTTLIWLEGVEVVKVDPRDGYRRLALACQCRLYESGQVDVGDVVLCPDHGEQRVVTARAGRAEALLNEGVPWPDAHRWRPQNEATMNIGDHYLGRQR